MQSQAYMHMVAHEWLSAAAFTHLSRFLGLHRLETINNHKISTLVIFFPFLAKVLVYEILKK